MQKVLASAGFGSRRACEELIAAGRVRVNGRRVALGARVDPAADRVEVDGSLVPTAPTSTYLAVHKPLGVLSAMSDARGRPTLADLVPDQPARLFHVGRLDADSEGLILLTNDGELAHRLTHPSYAVPKTYLAEIDSPVPRDLGRRLRRGVDLPEGPVAADSFRLLDRAGGRAMVELVVHEGRKHVVRRMLATAGHPVRRLVRIAVGPIRLGSLKAGHTRKLRPDEVRELYRAVGL